MAQVVKLKRTAVQGKIPTTSNLELGELAINTYDGRIFFEKDDGTPSIQEILTTNALNSGSFNLTGAISASSFVSASHFVGDGSGLINVTATSVPFSSITGKPTLVSGSSQIDVTQTQLYSSLATTGSNTFVGTQTIQNSSVGANYSLQVQGSTTGDRFGIVTNSTAGNGIIINSRNSSNTTNTKLSFSGSSFEFGGGDVNILGNLTLGGNITIGDNPADVITVTAGFSGSLIPDETTTYDLGSSSKKWNELYVETTYSNLLRLDENGTGLRMTNVGAFDNSSGDFRIFATHDLILATNGQYGTAVTIDKTTKNATFVGDISAVNLNLSGDATFTNAVTASHFVGDGSGLTGVVANGTVSGSDQLTSSLDLLYESKGSGILSSSNETFVEFSSSVDSRLDSLEDDTGSQDSRLDSLEAATSSYYSSTSNVVNALSNTNFDLGTSDITANSFIGDGSSLTNVTVSQAATVADSFTNQTSVTVTHNFNTRNILVAVYDNSNNQIIPQNVNTTNLDQAVITFPSAVTGTVVVAKGGHIVTATATSFGGNFASDTSLNGYTLSGSGNIDLVGDLTVNGNTTITGTLTLSNADDIRIEDNTLLLNWGKGNTDGGLEISATTGQTGSLLWDESAGYWKGGNKGSEYRFYTVNDFSISNINSFTQSIDTRVTNTESTGSVHESRLDSLESATGSYQSLGAGVLSGSQQITDFGFISGSDLDDIHLYTSSLKTAIEVSGTNLTVLGDLTVQGTNTSLNTTQLLIEDKLITLASGSTTSLQADGAGIEIEGANKSLTWNHTNSSFLFDAKVSSSVGFKGNGSELTDIVYSNIDFGGTGVLSGSDQVTSSLDLRYLEINGDGVLSGSDQVTSSLDLRYLEINGDGVLSGSDQVTSSIDLRYLEINGDNVLSSSNENFSDFSQSIDTRLQSAESFSASLDINNAILTGSFTGSFTGDGSGLTGLTVDQVASVTASFSNQSTINVAHNFDTYNVITSVYDDTLNQIIPQTVSLTDTNTLQVVLSSTESGHVVVAKGGHVIGDGSYRVSVSGNTSYTITHNLNEDYPFVQSWNTVSGQMEIPKSVTSNSSNELTVVFDTTFSGKIIVKK